MCDIRIGKVVLNIGVGKSGDVLERAKRTLDDLSNQKSCPKMAKRTVRDFGIHKGESIAAMVTLRGDKALETLKRLLVAKGMRIPASSFDGRGNCSFGIKEHIEIPNMRYDPDIGIFGLNVSAALERPGYRVSRRRRVRSKVGRNHVVTKDEAEDFFKKELGVEVY
ncbi:MAG: 50S ribosomal protein L5 [Nitrososphaerales archaeon]|nr:50S ribosomal protein L5 [Nitrososphaerales archaeon]